MLSPRVPVLLVDDNPQTVLLVQEALQTLDEPYGLKVLSSALDVYHYLFASEGLRQSPAAIMLKGSDGIALSMLAGFGVDRDFPEVPIITLGVSPGLPHFYRVDAAVERVTSETLTEALRGILQD